LAFSPDGRTLAFGDGDSTVLLRDLTGEANRSKKEPLTAESLAACWSNLANDAATAEKALWQLVFSPKESVAFLFHRLKTLAPADPNQVAQLVKGLDSETVTIRQKAAQELEKLGESAETQVRQLLKSEITFEVRQRLQQFVANRERDAVRKLRCLEILEQIASPEARHILESLREASNPRLALGAAEALARLEKRGF
jgi:hypothetical protein